MTAPNATALSRVDTTNPMLREVNHGLAVMWINADLIERANFDVRRDIILYDDATVFVAMLPIVLGPVLPDSVQAKLYEVGVRSYSVGIV